MPDRDNQQKKCYAWETELAASSPLLETKLTFEQCRWLAEDVWAAYSPAGCPPVRVRKGRRGSYARGGGHLVTIPPELQARHYVLHEVAHCIAGATGGWHGPRFIRLLVNIFERWAKVPQSQSMKVARKHRLRVQSFEKGIKPKRRTVALIDLSKPRTCAHKWVKGTKLRDELKYNGGWIVEYEAKCLCCGSIRGGRK